MPKLIQTTYLMEVAGLLTFNVCAWMVGLSWDDRLTLGELKILEGFVEQDSL